MGALKAYAQKKNQLLFKLTLKRAILLTSNVLLSSYCNLAVFPSYRKLVIVPVSLKHCNYYWFIVNISTYQIQSLEKKNTSRNLTVQYHLFFWHLYEKKEMCYETTLKWYWSSQSVHLINWTVCSFLFIIVTVIYI